MAATTHRVAIADTSNAATYTSGAFTPGADELLVVFAVVTATAAAGTCTSSVSGHSFKQITTALKASSGDKLYCYVSNQLATAVSQTVTIDVTGDNGTSCVGFVAGVSGMVRIGAGAVRQSAVQSNQASGTPAPAFSQSALTGNVTLGFVGNATNPAALTPPTSWTEPTGGDTGIGTPATGGEYVFRDSGFTGTTITWGSAGGVFGDIIIELDTSTPLPLTPAVQCM